MINHIFYDFAEVVEKVDIESNASLLIHPLTNQKTVAEADLDTTMSLYLRNGPIMKFKLIKIIER